MIKTAWAWSSCWFSAVGKVACRSSLPEYIHQAMTPATDRRHRERGRSLVEFALLFPLIFLLIVNAVNFGACLYAWITVANAARAGAEYALMGGAMASAPGTPTAAQVTTLITN